MNVEQAAEQKIQPALQHVREHARQLESACEEFQQQADETAALRISTFCNDYPEEIRSDLNSRLRMMAYFANNRAQQLDERDWPSEGTNFQEFQVRGELGRGGIGRVYLVWDSKLERHVALKVAPFQKEEALLLAQLPEHPNVVKVHSIVEDDATGLNGLCMPFLGQATLAQFLTCAGKQQFPPQPSLVLEDLAWTAIWQHMDERPKRIEVVESYWEQVVQWTDALASGLQSAHDCGVLHLDVKPSNVLLTDSGRPVLIDFNLAVPESEHNVALGGTAPYMSPEQLAQVQNDDADEVELNSQSDVYSLGILFTEMLLGRHPLVGEDRPVDPDELVLLVQKRQQTWIQDELRGEARLAPYRRGLEKWLALSPQDRWTMAEVRRWLANWQTPFGRLRNRAANRPWLTTSLALTATALLLAIASLAINRKPKWERLRDSAVVFLEAGELDQALDCIVEAHDVGPTDQKLQNLHLETNKQLGIRAYNAQQWKEALTYLHAAELGLSEEPELTFYLGASYLEDEQFDKARRCLQQVYEFNRDEQILLALCYCSIRLQESSQAESYLDQLQSDGTDLAAVYCGLSEIQGLNHRARAKYAEEALKCEEAFAPALYSRAIAKLYLAKSRRARVDKQALSDMEQAIKQDVVGARVYYTAAELWDLWPQKTNQRKMKVLEYLKRSLELGTDPEALVTSQLFGDFRYDEEFRALYEIPRADLVLRQKFPRTWQGHLSFQPQPADVAVVKNNPRRHLLSRAP